MAAKFSLTTVLAIFGALIIHFALAQLAITRVDPMYGSIAGGTRLTIFGSGFGDMYTSVPVVFLGKHACAVISHLSTNEVITCQTPAGSPGTFPVTVALGDQGSVTALGFTYALEHTPTLRAVTPRAGPPGTPLSLFGASTGGLRNQDCLETSWGEITCVGGVTFGDYLCRQDPSREEAAIAFLDFQAYSRYGYSVYRVGCTLPAPDASDTQPGLGTAESANVTLQFEASMRGGLPSVLRDSYTYDVDGMPYHFQLYAELTGVSPGFGSAAGGTLVQLSGRGFPPISLGRGEKVEILIARVPCTVVNSTYETVYCITGPQPDILSAEGTTPLCGQYPGMRGVEYEFYNTSITTASLQLEDLWRLNSTILLSNTTGTGSYKAVLTDVWESPDYAAPNHCTRMKAFFVAPRAGPYRFYMQAGGFGQLNGTWLQNGSEVSRPLVNVTAWTATDAYFQYPFQASEPMFLASGQHILLKSAHCSSSTAGNQQVAVRMPVPGPRANSIAEVQSVKVASKVMNRKLYIKLLYGAGANTTAYWVNVTSSDDSLLDDPRVGLQLTLNSGAVSTTLPVAATSAALDDLVEAALGGDLNAPSNDHLFGLRKLRTPGVLALQLGMDSARADTVGFTVSAARLVMIGDSIGIAPSPAANCTFAGGLVPYSSPPSAPPVAPAPALDSTEVTITRSELVPEGLLAGDFYLSSASGSAPLRLPFNASAADVRNAVYGLTGRNTSVEVASTWREGAYLGRVWTVDFPPMDFNNVPDVSIAPGDSLPVGVLVEVEARPASPPISGEFMLSYGDFCDSVAISPTDDAAEVRRKLGTLPGMALPQSVDISGNAYEGYTFTITFDPFGNPGDQPPLRVTDSSGLSGFNASVTVSTILDGSIDAFYAPIPTEFLRLPVSDPGSISVSINGIPSACAHPSGICKFTYTAAPSMPMTTGVYPTTLAFSSFDEFLPLTISGTFLDAGKATVTVGRLVCNVTSATGTQLVCLVSASSPAGVQLVNVNVAGLGNALGAANVTLKTLAVTGTAPGPELAISAAGISIFNISGRGFNGADCTSLRIYVGAVECGILQCDERFATVLYPGNGGLGLSAATVTAQVVNNGVVTDQSTQGSAVTVEVIVSAPMVTELNSSSTVPSADGVVHVSLSGVSLDEVSGMFLVPQRGVSAASTAAPSVAYGDRVACSGIAVDSNGTAASCKCPAVPNGKYHMLVVLSSGLQLLSWGTIDLDFVVTAVTPNEGSIAGGTVLTISGRGFSQVAAENVVFLTVPVSSTFPNGVVQCVTLNVTPSALTCITKPHLLVGSIADAAAVVRTVPMATSGKPISVLICGQEYTKSPVLLQYCASQATTPRARALISDGASLDYGYSAAVTPVIGDVRPSKVSGGMAVTISGTLLGNVTRVELLQNEQIKAYVAEITASESLITVVVPDLPVGVYTVQLRKTNGELSVDPYGSGVLTYTPSILGLSDNAGSVAGGQPLVITVGGAGLAAANGDLQAAAANSSDGAGAGDVYANGSLALETVVTIGGLPCPIARVANRTSLTCVPSGAHGYVLAEYWNLASPTDSTKLVNLTQPAVSRLESGISFDWGTGSPANGIIQPDNFGARFTFYLETQQSENVSFYISADDTAQLYVDDVLVGGRSTSLGVAFTPGIHKVVLTYTEYYGLATVKLLVSYVQPNGYLSTWAAPAWQKVLPYPPGTPLPVRLAINGIEAEMRCPESNATLLSPYRTTDPYEPVMVSSPNGTCAFIFTAQMTPTLTSLIAPSFTASNASLSISGSFLLNPNLTAMSQLNVTIGGKVCAITDVSSSNDTTGALDVTRVNCTLPALPVGTYQVNVYVTGLGFARPPLGFTTAMPTVTYPLRFLKYTSPPSSPSSPQCYFSLFGGGTFSMNGFGLLKNVTDPIMRRVFKPIWEPTSTCTGTAAASTPPCLAALASIGLSNYSSSMTLVPVASDGVTATVQVTRFRVTNAEAFAGKTNISAAVRYRPRIYYLDLHTPQFDQQMFADPLYFCGGRTPVLSNISPATITPDAGSTTPNATLILTWSMSGAGSNGDVVRATSVSSPSNATVEFEVGNLTYPCANAIVTNSKLTATNYSESIRCDLPAFLPAANYTLWLCVQPFGCGLLPSYPVTLMVDSASPLSGSSAGGTLITITGNGFDTNASRVAVRFGNSTCRVISSDGRTITCTTEGLGTKPTAPVDAPLAITPTTGAAEVIFPGFTFNFDPMTEFFISSVTPSHASAEGGTPIMITGANFVPGVPTNVTIGDTLCSSVAVVNATAITCVTGRSPNNSSGEPLPVQVSQEGRGDSRGTVSFQYFHLWSSNFTWGGGPLPGYEDSVVVPPGVTILLDMSPPKLSMLVLRGNLLFDETQAYMNLQAHSILVDGGNFTVGSASKPYPGRANITLHGTPTDARALPLYGSKVLAVRQGAVTLFGQAKVPHYTTLNQTADPGATRITINGIVNWQVGDRIVIASSSFFAEEVHEATITDIDTSSTPGCSILSLDTPTQYTHLGEIHSQPGVEVPLDMRAEVAVLTRNILLTGDHSSSKTMYGAQVMVHSPPSLPRALVRLDNVEVALSGQAFHLRRHPIHLHMHGDVAFQSWVRNCSVHNTFSRATAIHGTHQVLYADNLAYNVMGHAFFLEDGSESGNVIDGNIGIYTKASDALLNFDTTPAAFWITNPNNTLRNNRATGSVNGHGFWYRLPDTPEGPSFTASICPKFNPMAEFSNNTAHSNTFDGLRIHPEFYPRSMPCTGFGTPFAQLPAVFNGLVAFKNGMKGAAATQVGLVQFTNLVMGDNGGGPRQLVTGNNDKDNGASIEVAWVVDDRNRYDVALSEMAGFTNATIYARTSTGNRGSAGAWWSGGRRVAGVIAQSPALGHPKHSALLSLTNVTFVDFGGPGTGFWALEHCGRCKPYQGGATTFTANITFINTDGGKPGLSFWSWGHQGVFLDTDGSLLNAATLPNSLLPSPASNWTLGAGATWHSAVENELFDQAECVYVRGAVTSNDGAFCRPGLTFRRIMLNEHGPPAIKFNDLRLVSLMSNRTSVVHYSAYNEDGYQFTLATGHDYWLNWDTGPYRVDPESFRLHKMDPMDNASFVFLTAKYAQCRQFVSVNGVEAGTNASTLLPSALSPSTLHGASTYDTTFTSNSWWWGNSTYKDTKLTVYLAGSSDTALAVATAGCRDQQACWSICGFTDAGSSDSGLQNSTLLWSDASTWALRPGGKPAAGDNVTIPWGWDLVIDESPPPLCLLVIQGTVRFDPSRDVNLTASYVLVTGKGSLSAGTPAAPHPTSVTIKLSGSRATPDFVVGHDLNLGCKVLAAIDGGTINLFGREVGQRWIRLGAPAAPGDANVTVSNPNHGWRVGDKVLVTSTTFNVWQSEMRTISAIHSGGSVLALDSPLTHPHSARVKAYQGGGPIVDTRAEVALLSSNILITAEDGAATYTTEYFGARVVVYGDSVGRFSNLAMEYCGQYGLLDRACILFDRLLSVPAPADNGTTPSPNRIPNPSILHRCAIVWGMNSNLRVSGSPGVADPVSITENIMYEALDAHSVEIFTTGNEVKGNLVLGTKCPPGTGCWATSMPANIMVWSARNWVEGNIAAGSDRYGYTYNGVPCDESFSTGSFHNNTAHSCLAGLWLRASDDALLAGCTSLRNFSAYMNWDFGIVSTQGLATDLRMEDVNVLDTKHSGVTLFRRSRFTERSGFNWQGGLLAGQSGDDVCTACSNLSDPGCHQRLSVQSYNKVMPFSPSVGLQSAMFALGWSAGPEKRPYDQPMGYSVIHGYFNISGVTIADFFGRSGCGGADVGTYALANHPQAPEASFPHFFSKMNVVNVTSDGPGQSMFYHTPPDPAWRNELDCGDGNYTREDGTQIPLNCAGPAHVYWRDLDGSLLAGGDPAAAGTIAGIFMHPRAFPYDQGSPVLPGACTYSQAYHSYRCSVGSSDFLLDSRYKPEPIPPAGIWGDPQHFVLESRDSDTEGRDFGPVFFNVSGSVDLVTAAMDHSTCYAYTCQKRLSTFWTYLPSFQTAYVNFTGTPPKSFRLWYPYADPTAELVLVFHLPHTLNRRFVWLPPGNGSTAGRTPPEPKPVKVGDGTGHGAFYWDQDGAKLHVKIQGGKTLEARTEDAVLITQAFAVSVDEFYGMNSFFLASLSNSTGIPREQLYTPRVLPGSAVVTIGVTPAFNSTTGALPEYDPVAAADPNAGEPAPASPPPSPAPGPPSSSGSQWVTEMLANVQAVTVVLQSSDAAKVLGVQPIGTPMLSLSSVQDASLAQQLASSATSVGLTVTQISSTPSSPYPATPPSYPPSPLPTAPPQPPSPVPATPLLSPSPVLAPPPPQPPSPLPPSSVPLDAPSPPPLSTPPQSPSQFSPAPVPSRPSPTPPTSQPQPLGTPSPSTQPQTPSPFPHAPPPQPPNPSPPLPEPHQPPPVNHQVGLLNGGGNAVQAVSAATVAASTAGSVVAAVAGGVASILSGGTTAGSAWSGALGTGSSSVASTGLVAASLFIQHMQFFAITPDAAANSSVQFRQVNDDLGWLNLAFATLRLRRLPRTELAAYNQILNCGILIGSALALHFGLLKLFKHWRPLRSVALPAWFVWPHLELFLCGFCLTSLAEAAAALLASAAVTHRAIPGVVGGVVASLILVYAALIFWVVLRLCTSAGQLGLLYRPRSSSRAGSSGGASAPIATVDKGDIAASAPPANDLAQQLAASLRARSYHVGAADASPQGSSVTAVQPAAQAAGTTAWLQCRSASEGKPLPGGAVHSEGPYTAGEAEHPSRPAAWLPAGGVTLVIGSGGSGGAEKRGDSGQSGGAACGGRKPHSGRSQQADAKSGTGFVGFLKKLVLLGEWNRPEGADAEQLEPQRTRAYINDGMSPYALTRCLSLASGKPQHVTGEAGEAAAEGTELPSSHQGPASPATSADSSGTGQTAHHHGAPSYGRRLVYQTVPASALPPPPPAPPLQPPPAPPPPPPVASSWPLQAPSNAHPADTGNGNNECGKRRELTTPCGGQAAARHYVGAQQRVGVRSNSDRRAFSARVVCGREHHTLTAVRPASHCGDSCAAAGEEPRELALLPEDSAGEVDEDDASGTQPVDGASSGGFLESGTDASCDEDAELPNAVHTMGDSGAHPPAAGALEPQSRRPTAGQQYLPSDGTAHASGHNLRPRPPASHCPASEALPLRSFSSHALSPAVRHSRQQEHCDEPLAGEVSTSQAARNGAHGGSGEHAGGSGGDRVGPSPDGSQPATPSSASYMPQPCAAALTDAGPADSKRPAVGAVGAFSIAAAATACSSVASAAGGGGHDGADSGDGVVKDADEAGKRDRLLARAEVYDRYGLLFADYQGHRALAMTFQMAILINALLPSCILGLQAGSAMKPGSRAAIVANAFLLGSKAAYALYVTAVRPYLNVILIAAETTCAWLEVVVCVCILAITVTGGAAGGVLASPPPPAPPAVSSSTPPPHPPAAGEASSPGSAALDILGAGSLRQMRSARDAMLVCEIIVLAVQVLSITLTTVIPAAYAVFKAVALYIKKRRARSNANPV